jgi:hypothetical protein
MSAQARAERQTRDGSLLAEKLEACDFEDEASARRFAREMAENGRRDRRDLSDEIEELIELEARGDDEAGAVGAEGGVEAARATTGDLLAVPSTCRARLGRLKYLTASIEWC